MVLLSRYRQIKDQEQEWDKGLVSHLRVTEQLCLWREATRVV